MSQFERHLIKGLGTDAPLTEQELQALSANAVVRKHPKGSIVVEKGDHTDSLFIIKSGRVKVFLRNSAGKEIVLNIHGPGEYFGEMALDSGPRSASVIALEPTRLFVIPKENILQMLSSDPDFSLRLIYRLMQRVRALTERVGDLALKDVYGRLTRLLQEQAIEHEGRLIVPERPSQKDLAERIGASREMVSRVIKDLVAGGYVTLESRKIVINKRLPLNW